MQVAKACNGIKGYTFTHLLWVGEIMKHIPFNNSSYRQCMHMHY